MYRCEITASPRLWLLIDQVGQKLDESADMEQLTKAWMQELAFVHSASVVPREAVAGGREEMERKSGFCIEEETARQLSLAEGEKVKKLFYESCIHTVTRLAEGESLMGHVTLYARENGWEITGDAAGGERSRFDEPGGFCRTAYDARHLYRGGLWQVERRNH